VESKKQTGKKPEPGGVDQGRGIYEENKTLGPTPARRMHVGLVSKEGRKQSALFDFFFFILVTVESELAKCRYAESQLLVFPNLSEDSFARGGLCFV